MKLERKSNYAWIAFIGTCAVFIVMGALYNTVNMYVSPILKAHPDLTRGVFTITTTIQSAVSALFSALIGKLIKKVGIRRLMFIGCLFAVLSQFIYSVSPGIVGFYIAAALYGVSLPLTMFVLGPVIVNNWFAKNIGLLIGVVSASISVGGAVFGPIVGSWIDTLGYQGSYRMMMIVLSVGAIVGLILVRDKPAPGTLRLWEKAVVSDVEGEAVPQQEEGLSLAEAKKTLKFKGLLVAAFLLTFTYASILATLPIFSADIGFDSAHAGMVMSAYSATNIIFSIVGGYMCDKLGCKFVMCTGGVAVIIEILILLNIGKLPQEMMYVAAAFMGYGGLSFMAPLQVGTRLAFGSKDYGSILGVVTAFRTVGTAVGVPLLQFTYDTLGSYDKAFYVLIVLIVVHVLLFGWVFTEKKEPKVTTA